MWSCSKPVASSKRLASADKIDSPVRKKPHRYRTLTFRVIRLARPPLNAHEQLKQEAHDFRRGLTDLSSLAENSETDLRRQYVAVLKRYHELHANRDQKDLARTDLMIVKRAGESWIEYPERSESADNDHLQDQTAALGGRLRDGLDLQLEIKYLENACFLHEDRTKETKSEKDRLDEFARFGAGHFWLTGKPVLSHILIPIIPSTADSYIGVTGWLDDQLRAAWRHDDSSSEGRDEDGQVHNAGQQPIPLPTKEMLDRSSHWQWPEVKLAVYSWAFYALLNDPWEQAKDPAQVGLSVLDIYLHARDGLSHELREKYSTARLFGL
jgi:hypothetical protein